MKRILKRAILMVGGVLAVVLLAAASAVAVLLAWPVPAPLEPNPTSGPVAIVDVNVVDPAAGVLLPNQTVVVEGGRIVRLGPTRASTLPTRGRVIDGTGKFVIPGLWDMHVHLASKLAPQLTMPLFVANGVTNVREMGAFISPEQVRNWKSDIAAGNILGPRVMGHASFIVSRFENADELAELVDRVRAQDEFIKVLDDILPGAYFQLLEAAEAKGATVLGHRPRAVRAIDAVEAGHASFEHARLFLFEGYPGADELRERYRAAYAGEEIPGGPIQTTTMRREMVDGHDAGAFAELVDAMVRNRVWFCPTHVTRRMEARADAPAFRRDPRLKYINAGQRGWWQMDADGVLSSDPSPAGRRAFEDFYRKGLELTGRAHRAGVRILAGTDANDTYCFPGFGMHDELRELVKAGLTPMEALRTATVNPADYFGESEEYGSIAVGQVADLVILDANPLENIANTSSVHTVLYGGDVYGREDLDRMLAYVERNASRWSLLMKAGWEKLFFEERRSAEEILQQAP